MLFLSALVIAAAVSWAGYRIARELSAARPPRVALLDVAAIFAPGIEAATGDPRAMLTWQPLAVAMRTIYPEEFAALDRACGGTFPFSTGQLQAAHSRWTADWLAWEQSHDTEYKLKATLLQHDLADEATSPAGRARLHAVEAEKLERYQRRYEEYTRVARALQAFLPR